MIGANYPFVCLMTELVAYANLPRPYAPRFFLREPCASLTRLGACQCSSQAYARLARNLTPGLRGPYATMRLPAVLIFFFFFTFPYAGLARTLRDSAPASDLIGYILLFFTSL